MTFTKEQAELNGKAVAAHLQKKPIEIDGADNDHWTAIWNLDHIATRCHRPAPDPAPPERWSRMEHVPLPCWMKSGSAPSLHSIDRLSPDGILFNGQHHDWEELDAHSYTTGERDASGAFIFRECLVLP